MNTHLFVPVLAVVLAACSGASAQLVDEPREDAGDSVSSSIPSVPSSGGSATGAGGGDDASSGQSGGQGSDAGSGTSGQSGPGNGNGDIDAGVAPLQCPSGGTTQGTSGDSQSNPTEFDTVACGTLGPNESYFWTFRLPASVQKFGMNFTGGIQIQLTLDGKTVDVVPGANLPFRTRDPYLVQITPSGNTTESYVFEVIEK